MMDNQTKAFMAQLAQDVSARVADELNQFFDERPELRANVRPGTLLVTALIAYTERLEKRLAVLASKEDKD